MFPKTWSDIPLFRRFLYHFLIVLFSFQAILGVMKVQRCQKHLNCVFVGLFIYYNRKFFWQIDICTYNIDVIIPLSEYYQV